MKPNRTSMLLRSLYKDLGSEYKVDSEGYPTLESLAEYTFPDPASFSNAKDFAIAYQVYNLSRKREFNTPTSAQMRGSLEKWAESEFRCHTVNRYGWWVRPIEVHKRARLDTLFQRVRAIISDVLCDQWPDLDFDPTGGATATTSRRYAIASSKVDGTPLTDDMQPHKSTPASRVYLEQMLLNNPGVARRFMRARDKLIHDVCPEPIEITYDAAFLDSDAWRLAVRELAIHLCSNVPPAVFDYVSKDIKSVRLIAKSNSLAIMVQKTFGECIRKALLKVGINLNDQTINQEWAEIGSLTNLVATVDLSSASDSISLHMVNLFPRRWQAYFNASRDTHVAVKGNKHRLAMIAGMGNGYIFELQSLLFYAMTKAAVEECKLDTSWISVYGDDIICPVGAVSLLEEMLLSKGFLLNREKTFSDGKFRESCGKHYFNGCDVTPWYIKSDLDNIPELYHHYNGLSEWANRIGYPMDKSLRLIGNCVPQNERHMVPLTWSTKSGFHYYVDGVKYPQRKWNTQYQRFEVVWSVLTQRPKNDLRGRLPERIQIVDSLISLDCAELIIDPALFLNVLTPTRAAYTRNGVECYQRHRAVNAPMTSYSTPAYCWSFVNHRTKHRGETLCGDA